MQHYFPHGKLGQILGRYPFCGFPIINDSSNKRTCSLYFNWKLFDELLGMYIPDEIIKELMEITGIFELNCTTKSKSFNIFMNIPIEASKLCIWMSNQDKWYKFFVEQCSVRYISSDNSFVECKNLIISPGNGTNCIYSRNQYGCCIAHVQGRCKYYPSDCNYSCRACWKCVQQVIKPDEISELNEMNRTECVIKMECLSVFSNQLTYTKSVGNSFFYQKLLNMGMNFKHNHFKHKGKTKLIKASNLYITRLNHYANLQSEMDNIN